MQLQASTGHRLADMCERKEAAKKALTKAVVRGALVKLVEGLVRVARQACRSARTELRGQIAGDYMRT
jgi:hypothetical protein